MRSALAYVVAHFWSYFLLCWVVAYATSVVLTSVGIPFAVQIFVAILQTAAGISVGRDIGKHVSTRTRR